MLQARLYLISSTPQILDVIIRKNAELGRNYSTIVVGNKWFGFSDVTKTESRADVFFDAAVVAGEYPGILPRTRPVQTGILQSRIFQK